MAKIKEIIDFLEIDPRHHGSIKLTGVDHVYRTSMGRYRILYKIIDEHVHVIVVDIDHRKDAYK